MRNLFLFTISLLLAGQLSAQVGIEFTAGYTPGISFILNDDDFTVGDDLNYLVSYGSNAIVTAGFNFSEKVGLATGVALASINQRYTSNFGNIARAEQNTFDRRLVYLRVPLMLRIGGDPTAATSAFFRFGPHVDFLTGASGNFDIRADASNNRTVGSVNYKNKEEIYRELTIGLAMDVGGRIRITDDFGLLLLFHLESSLTNPEGGRAGVEFASNSQRERAGSFNIMPGVNVSLQYVLNFD